MESKTETVSHVPRILLAAVSSGCGKTTITCGILQALKNQGMVCRAWKCGPDYIDPMFHKYALGIEGGNLDSFFADGKTLTEMVLESSRGSDLTVIEGVMGYYDGCGGTTTKASSYETAVLTGTPVILIVDGKGASVSLAAVIRGFTNYRNDHQIRGVILNRTSPVMAERLRPLLEEERVELLGAIPDTPGLHLDSRHLGLVMPQERESIQKALHETAELVGRRLNLKRILEIAQEAPPLRGTPPAACGPVHTHTRIAVARDEAFCFYYQENLRLLEKMGAFLIPFSPLHDAHLPPDIDGLILGGGYPELYAGELAANETMRRDIAASFQRQMPVLAECGGFMYLHEQLADRNGAVYPMVGAVKGKTYPTDRLQRFGYLSLTAQEHDSCLQGSIRGHEFHYWESENCGTDWKAEKPAGNRFWQCMHSSGGQILGFPHLYYPSNPDFIKNWLLLCNTKKSVVKSQ